MSTTNVLKREMRVAFSKRAQPIWFRMLKWAIAIGVTAMLWRSEYFWFWILGALALSLTLHFVWRWKTKGWTQPWFGWNDLEAPDKD